MKQTIPRSDGDSQLENCLLVTLVPSWQKSTSPWLCKDKTTLRVLRWGPSCLPCVFQWQMWHTQPQASKPQSSACIWSGDRRANQVKESHSLVLSCVTGEFVLHGPTEVFATWAKVWCSFTSARDWHLNAQITFVLEKPLWSWSVPHMTCAPTQAFSWTRQYLP